METTKNIIGKMSKFPDGSEQNLSVYNLTLLNIKYIFKNKTSLFQLLLFLVLALIVPIIFMPILFVVGACVLLYLIVPSLIVMGNVGYEMRKSSLYKNIVTSGYKKRQFYLPSILTLFILALFLSVIFWPSFWLLSKAGLIMLNWRTRGFSFDILSMTVMVGIVYIIFIEVLVSFAFYFLIHNIAKTSNIYYSSVMMILILGIIFGGSLNSYFGNYIGYQHILNDFDLTNKYSFTYNGGQNKVWIVFAKQSNYDELYSTANIGGINMANGLFPESIFIPTLFYPFFGVGQFATTLVGFDVQFNQYQNSYTVVVPDNVYETLHGLEIINWIEVGIVDSIATGNFDFLDSFSILDSYDRGFGLRDMFYVSFKKEYLPWTLTLLQPYLTTIIYFLVGKAIIEIKD